MLTMRPFNEDKTWGDKQKKDYVLDNDGNKIYDKSRRQYKCKSIPTTEWNDQSKAEEWRGAWTEIVNRFLEQNDHAERIDHRSYDRQGIDQIPTVHMGTAATQMEKRGIRTERGNINREIAVTNSQMNQLKARIRKAKNWLYAQPESYAYTSLDMMKGIADSKNLESHWKKLTNLKTQANVLMFLQNNEIGNVTELTEKAERIYDRTYEVSKNIRAIDRRMGTLNQHLKQYEITQEYRDIYAKYKRLDPKKRTDFRAKHSDEIQSYEAANEYLNTVMSGRANIPVKEWKSEQMELVAKKFMLCEEFYRLKEETRSVEALRKSITDLIDVKRQQIERESTRFL